MRLSDYFGFCFDMKVSIAAGCFGVDGYGKNFDKQYWSLFEGATLKTTTLLPIEPEPLPIPDFIKVGDNYFNAVRLRNPGIANIKLDDLPSNKQFRLSLWASSLEDTLTATSNTWGSFCDQPTRELTVRKIKECEDQL